MTVTISPAAALAADIRIAENSYDEACRVTEAYQLQLSKRRQNKVTNEAEQAKRIDEATRYLEAAERAEYAAWSRLDHLRKSQLSMRPGKR